MRANRERMPTEGDSLITGADRRFVITRAELVVRGWWFEARAVDGASRLLGNGRLRWDEAAQVWRLEGDDADTRSPPRRARLRTRPSRRGALEGPGRG